MTVTSLEFGSYPFLEGQIALSDGAALVTIPDFEIKETPLHIAVVLPNLQTFSTQGYFSRSLLNYCLHMVHHSLTAACCEAVGGEVCCTSSAVCCTSWPASSEGLGSLQPGDLAGSRVAHHHAETQPAVRFKLRRWD